MVFLGIISAVLAFAVGYCVGSGSFSGASKPSHNQINIEAHQDDEYKNFLSYNGEEQP